MEYVTIYDQQGQMLAVLDNATEVGYELKHNDLWTGQFSLPAGDPKNQYCQARNWVRIPDGSRETGLFRIVGMPQSEETALGGMKTYQLEHVMATLLDDVLFGYHEVGGVNMNTAGVIQYILARQTVTRWQLGTCAYTDNYQYNFENVTLLSALMSLGEVLTGEYTWEFDTTTTPWTVSLKAADATPGCGIHYGRNLVGIEKTMDASALITRLYPLGYGEGVNQLTIKDANNGVAYIDADTISTWGVCCNVWTDTRIQDAETLLARGQQVLNGYKNPYITYTASAIDLYRQTGYSWDNNMPGKLVRVMDSEHDISFDARIVSISKSDVNGDPGDVTIVIANAPRDTADAVNTLADKVGIGELYSQGATNLFAQTFADNADDTHPATMKFYVPGTLVRINQLLLTWNVSNFRTYSKGASAGGGGTVTTETTVVTDDHLSGGVQGNLVTEAAGGHGHAVNSHHHSMSHGHGVDSHTHSITAGATATGPAAPATSTYGGDTGNSSPGTTEVQDHTHALYDHYHIVRVAVDIPALSVTLSPHTHGLTYGIYEGGHASSITVKVDGTTVPAASISGNEVDVIPWMDKDSDGKITRGTWHTIELVPDALTRIEANLFAQCFIQSRGGGDY